MPVKILYLCVSAHLSAYDEAVRKLSVGILQSRGAVIEIVLYWNLMLLNLLNPPGFPYSCLKRMFSKGLCLQACTAAPPLSHRYNI